MSNVYKFVLKSPVSMSYDEDTHKATYRMVDIRDGHILTTVVDQRTKDSAESLLQDTLAQYKRTTKEDIVYTDMDRVHRGIEEGMAKHDYHLVRILCGLGMIVHMHRNCK